MRVLLSLLLIPVFFRPCPAQCMVDDLTKILAADGDASDAFGKSVAMSQNRAVVGAKGDEANGIQPGSAYFLELMDGAWVETQKVFASDAANLNNFGWSVAMDGNRAVIGAPFAGGAGAAYVFEHDGLQFQETHKLVPSDPTGSDTFGWSVGIHGDVVIVGAPNKADFGTGHGAAYVFRLAPASWTQEARLMASDAVDFQKFGYAVAANATQVAVGAPFRQIGGPTPDPAVYLYSDIGATWGNEVKLANDEFPAADWFGSALAMNGDRLLVGASHDATNGVDAGAAFLYQGSGAAWNLQQKFTEGGSPGDVLGASVALGSDCLIVGALGNSMGGTSAGAALIYRNVAGPWVAELIYPPDPIHLGFFGNSVAIAGNQVLSAAVGDGDLGPGAGAVYSYTVPDLVLDVNTTAAQIGDTISFTACGGPPGNPLALFITAINGVPFTSLRRTGVFDVSAMWSLSGNVPNEPTLLNNAITFQCFAINALGNIVQSNDATIAFLP